MLANEGNGFRHSPMMHGPFQFEANAGIFLVPRRQRVSPRGFSESRVAGIRACGSCRMTASEPGSVRTGAIDSRPSWTDSLADALLYFSRFARNDIYHGGVDAGARDTAMWRYLDEWKEQVPLHQPRRYPGPHVRHQGDGLPHGTATLGLFLALMLLADQLAEGVAP